MYMSKDHAALRLRYIRKRIEKLPRGKEITFRRKPYIYIKEFPGRSELKTKRFSLRKKNARIILSQMQERERLLREIPMIESYMATPVRNRQRQTVMDQDFFTGVCAMADSNPYEKPKYAPEFNGIKYRSKSELNIAHLLLEAGFEFAYEPMIYMGGIKAYPDFVFYVQEVGRCFIWEHFGLWNDKDYRKDAQKKTELYLSRGCLPGRDVIFTYETDEIPFDVYAAREQMNAVIMTNVI